MSKKVYTALGLMSGTSLDGVDAAFLETDGEQIIRFGPSLMQAYSPEDRATLTEATHAAMRWQFKKGAKPNSFAAAEDVLHAAHAEVIDAICKAHPEWASRLDVIGFHGQTVAHHYAVNGRPGKTLQLGDGQILADKFGVPVIYDFRSNDVAAGGQGAPLAPIYHKALLEFSGFRGQNAVLNIGGVSNVTVVRGSDMIATDCGPGNGPLDNWTAIVIGKDYDAGGELSLSGNVNFTFVNQWLNRKFFELEFPKSADRYDFDVRPDMKNFDGKDGAATLAAFTAMAIAKSLNDMEAEPETLIVCGGGRHNKAIMWMLAEHCTAKVVTAEQKNWDGDAIEAQAFAYLAVRSKLGLPISFPMTTGAPAPMTGGRVAYPKS